jgi:uncharacterized protein YndB with AHSA1/START domain
MHVQLISCSYAPLMETVTRRVELDISPEALWNAITDGEMLAAWFGDTVDVDLRPGGTGAVIDEQVTRRLRVDAVEPGRGWSFDWSVDDEPASHVSFAIESTDDGGSRLTITETLSASASADRGFRWDLCALLLWACTMATALVR